VRAAVLVAVVAVAATGCGGGGTKSSVTTTVTKTLTTTNPTGTAAVVTTHGRFHYPDSIVKSYMESCTKHGQVKEAYCACTLDRLSNSVSTGDFARIGLSSGKIPPRINRFIRRAAIACADKL
jgi:hypothetical protein